MLDGSEWFGSRTSPILCKTNSLLRENSLNAAVKKKVPEETWKSYYSALRITTLLKYNAWNKRIGHALFPCMSKRNIWIEYR